MFAKPVILGVDLLQVSDRLNNTTPPLPDPTYQSYVTEAVN